MSCVSVGCVGVGWFSVGCACVGCVSVGFVAVACVSVICVSVGGVSVCCVIVRCVSVGCVGVWLCLVDFFAFECWLRCGLVVLVVVPRWFRCGSAGGSTVVSLCFGCVWLISLLF